MAAGVTPKQIYTALTGAGASTIQAIGIMANMIAESGLDPEAVGDQGTSFGLVQQHGMQYAGLVSGNPANDMNAQVKTMATNGGISAASGATGAAAAGNFAANYERCTTCQPGQASYNERVANAATVAGWVSSGSWPASAGSATAAAAGGGGAGSTSNSTDPTCAWGFSGSLVVTTLNICVVKKTTIRHAVGGLLLGAGAFVGLAGAAILAASALHQSAALARTAQAVAVLPGGERAAAPLRRAHTRVQGRS
jgi:Phage tail lysozyme